MENKKLTIFEFTIISFFVAVILSVAIVFVTNQVESSVPSFPLNYITLSFLIDKSIIDVNYQLAFEFSYYIIIFTLYGLLLGIINKYSNKIKYLSLLFVATIGFLIFQENSINKNLSLVAQSLPINMASVIKSTEIKNKKYFGLEAYGDLNSDNKDDVAFIIKRKDETRGDLYYLSASLATEEGYEGLNLIFLGDKVVPIQIAIIDGVIGVEKENGIFYAKVIDNEIKELIY
jgi:hypothetical protein